jgi:hypothetical protein
MRKLVRLSFRMGHKLVTSPREAWLLCRMGWWVAVLSVTARCFSLPRALRIVAGNQGRKRNSTTANPDELARAIDLVLSANALMFKPSCWKRAAVLHRYLQSSGINTRIMFGVRNEMSGEVAGHAWLEAGGQPILESAPPEYIVTYSWHSTERGSAG